MSAKNRADLITKLYKFVKKEYQPVPPPANRTVIEHMLYGCCLENSTYEAADNAFAKLQENYFDWNEVRVTTASELAELMKGLSEPKKAAVSVKKTLHGIFETYYQFDIDFLRKENLSKAVSQFEKFTGVSQFVVSYAAQNGLGGHSIPLDRSMLLLFYTIGAISEDEANKGRVPGLERTIPKAKGVEFSGLAHQLAVAFASSPFNTKIREQLLKINSKSKERFPKRGAAKKAAAEAKKAEEAAKKAEAAAKKAEAAAAKKAAAKKAADKKAAAKTATKKKSTAKTAATRKTAVKKKRSKATSTKKKTTKKKATPRVKPARKKTSKKKGRTPIKKKLTAKSKGKKSSATKRLAKKKPR